MYVCVYVCVRAYVRVCVSAWRERARERERERESFGVVLRLDKGDYPKNSHVVFKQRSFEPFMCLDIVF